MAIQPESFDLIVVGTGLEESLIAATAAKSGKSVLHLDQAKNYGAAWSSLTLEEILAWAQHHSSSTGQSAELANAVAQTDADQQLPGAMHIPTQTGHSELYSNVELFQQQADLGLSREYSVDLASKVFFCSSDTISTVLAFGVQNYLEFKLVQGSYILSDQKLISVPASRAAVFKDRSLSPMDKRVLTRFLMQLGSSLHDNPFPQAAPEQPMVSLLRSQGLSPLMRNFILHAVSMADADQEALVPETTSNARTQQPLPAATDTPARQLPAASLTGLAQPHRETSAAQYDSASPPSGASPPSQAEPSADPAQPTALDSQQATAASATSTNSHMDPGETATQSTAFHSQQAANAGPASASASVNPAQTTAPQSQQAADTSSSSATSSDGLLTVEQGIKALRQYMSSVGQYGPSSGAFLTPMYGCAELPQAFCRVAAVHGAVYVLRQPITSLLLHSETHQCQGIQTDAGQVIQCSALAASAVTLVNLHQHLQPLATAADSKRQQQPPYRAHKAQGLRLSKAICILDRPLQDGESQLLVTIPPQTEPLQNPNAIRAIQCGSNIAVCPSNRHMLYLTTPSTAETASADLSKALSALVKTDKAFARPLTESHLPEASVSSASTEAGLDIRPEALLVIFYNQDCQQSVSDEDVLPSNVACCLPPDGTVDVDSAVRHATQAIKKLYPDAAPVLSTRSPEDEDAESDDEALDALGGVLQGLASN